MLVSVALFVWAPAWAPHASAQGARPGAGQSARALALLLADEGLRPELVAALRAELLSSGYGLLVADSPEGETELQRASDAQLRGMSAGARVTLWLAPATEAMGGGVLVRALAAGSDEARYAPLPARLSEVTPRTFALVAGSLLDELEQPPESVPLRVRVVVEVEVAGETQVEAQAVVGPQDGTVVASAEEGGLVAEVREADGAPADVPGAVLGPPLPAEPHEPHEPQGDDMDVVDVIEEPGETPAPVEPALSEARDAEGRDVAVADDDPDLVHAERFFGADVVPFVGTSSRSRGQAIRHVSLNLVGGIDYALEGVDASLGFSIYRHRMAGVQMAMLFNYVGGDVHGLQLAGGMNFSRGAVHGAQLSSGLNYAQGAVHGAQLGSLNIARDVVHGLQVGLVNYAKDVDFALGLVNIVREGRTHLELTGSSDGMVNLTLKHGGRHFHYMYGLLARPDGAGTLIGAGMGLGGRVTFGDRVFVDIDTLAYAVQQRDEIGRNTSPDAMLVQRLMLGVRLFSRLALVGGVSYSLLWSDEGAPDYGSFGTQTLDEPVGGRSLSGWPNVVLGLQVL